MAVVYMTRVTISTYEDNVNNQGWEYKDTKASTGNGNSIIIPTCVKKISLTLEMTSGSGKVQTTTSKLADVVGGTEAWVDWTSGSVSANTREVFDPVTAVRLVNTSGTIYLSVRAQ